MIEVFRLVENQARIYGFKATLDEEEAIQLEAMLEQSKPKINFEDWEELIGTPFRYDLPVPERYQSRFCAPFSRRNVFYCSEKEMTTVFEYSYHFMRQRIHLQAGKKRKTNETGVRTLFSVDLEEMPHADATVALGAHQIHSRVDYSESHRFAELNKNFDVIKYTSARDVNHGINYAVFKIDRLGKKPKSERQFNYFYDYSKKTIYWIDQSVTISWAMVS